MFGVELRHQPGTEPADELTPLDCEAMGAVGAVGAVGGVADAEAAVTRLPEHVALRYGADWVGETRGAVGAIARAELLRRCLGTGRRQHAHALPQPAFAVPDVARPDRARLRIIRWQLKS